MVHKNPLRLRALNLTQTIDARIFCGYHARTGKVGDSYGDEKANDRNPEDDDSCLLCHTGDSTHHLTDDGPSAISELPGRIAGPPFGSALGLAPSGKIGFASAFWN